MKITLKKEMGMLIPYSSEDKEKLNSIGDGAVYEVDIKNFNMRTLQQNAALHKWCEVIAEHLNNSGLYISDIIKTETVWTMEKVKENIFKTVVDSLYNKKSTTKLNKDEFELVIDTITLAFGNKGIIIPTFPRRED